MNALIESLKRHQEGFIAGLPAKLASIYSAWSRYKRDSSDEEAYQSFYCTVHSIAGTAATFAVFPLSAISRRIQSLVKRLKPVGALHEAKEQARIDRLLDLLESEVLASQHNDEIQTTFSQFISQDWILELQPERFKKLLFIAEKDECALMRKEFYFGQSGYAIRTFRHYSGMLRNMQMDHPELLIIGLPNAASPYRIDKIIQGVFNRLQTPINIVFLVESENVERVQRLISGKLAFVLERPVSMLALVEHCDRCSKLN